MKALISLCILAGITVGSLQAINLVAEDPNDPNTPLTPGVEMSLWAQDVDPNDPNEPITPGVE